MHLDSPEYLGELVFMFGCGVPGDGSVSVSSTTIPTHFSADRIDPGLVFP